MSGRSGGWLGALLLLVIGLAVVSAQDVTTTESSGIDGLGTDGQSLSIPEKAEIIRAGFERVKPIFERSCFDCHSDQTDYPWYHSLPLISGIIDDHVRVGRQHLDFSFGYPLMSETASQRAILAAIRAEIESGDMPLPSYRLLHWGSAIEGPERDSVFAWIDSSLTLLSR